MGRILQAPLVMLLLLSAGMQTLAQMASTTYPPPPPSDPSTYPPAPSSPPPDGNGSWYTTSNGSYLTNSPNATDSYEPWVPYNCPAIADVSSSCSLPKDCSDVMTLGYRRSGVYNIYIGRTNKPIKVFCDMETNGGGWTMIQRRFGGETNFFRGWDEYRVGFGDDFEEFWIGNQKLHTLTNQKDYRLRVDLADFNHVMAFAEYETFSVGHAFSQYRLTVGGYVGNATDSLSRHNGMKFSTPDRDNDAHATVHCAEVNEAAWWFKNCGDSSLNGKAYWGYVAKKGQGIRWASWKDNYSFMGTMMMVRPNNVMK